MHLAMQSSLIVALKFSELQKNKHKATVTLQKQLIRKTQPEKKKITQYAFQHNGRETDRAIIYEVNPESPDLSYTLTKQQFS